MPIACRTSTLFALALVLAAWSPAAGLSGDPTQELQSATGSPEVSVGPQFTSSAPSVRAVSARFAGSDPIHPTVEATIENTSEKAIVALSFAMRGGDTDVVSTYSVGGGKKGLIAPGVQRIVTIPSENFRPGDDLSVWAVLFSDGSGEGDEAEVEALRKSRTSGPRSLDPPTALEPCSAGIFVVESEDGAPLEIVVTRCRTRGLVWEVRVRLKNTGKTPIVAYGIRWTPIFGGRLGEPIGSNRWGLLLGPGQTIEHDLKPGYGPSSLDYKLERVFVEAGFVKFDDGSNWYGEPQRHGF